MSKPYRESAKQAEPHKPRLFDATDDEVAFWERVYASAVTLYGQNCNDVIVAVADIAVLQRREAFGKYREDRTPFHCTRCGRPRRYSNGTCDECCK